MNLPSIGELLLIFFILLLVFGAGKLPALGEALGRGLRNFKRGVSGEAAAGKGSAGAGKPNA